jgi:hydrogenase/urease accessory protein HupE
MHSLLVLVETLCLATLLHAHDPGISTAQGEVRGNTIALTTGFAPADVQQLLPKELRAEGSWGQGEFDAAREALRAIAPQLWQASAGDTKLTPQDPRVELAAGDNVSFHVVFPLPPNVQKLTLRAPRIPELPSGHRQFVIISDERGSTITKKLLSARDYTIDVPLALGPALADGSRSADERPPDTASADTTFWGFIKLGIEHIWTGYDHLLFLFALLVVCRTFRSIAAIITCFTLAHSITLALATLDVVSVPSRIVEPAIAASIVFVGAENLWRRGAEPPGRWALTFAFGLIHGFGFASVLRDLGVGRAGEGVAMPLFTFNLGVEVGQIAVAAVVLPIVWQLRKRDWFVRWGVPVFSTVVAGAGLFWFLQRTIWS